MNRPMNLVAPMPCPSPECREFDRCNEYCACPNCSPFDSDHREIATAAWILLAPVADALNASDTSWTWAREHLPRRSADFHLLLGNDDVQIIAWRCDFIVQTWDDFTGSYEDRFQTHDAAEAADHAAALTKEYA